MNLHEEAKEEEAEEEKKPSNFSVKGIHCPPPHVKVTARGV